MSEITVLSLGAGVQSTTVLLMAEHGEIERPVEAVFADTGWEPRAVYAHLDWLRTQTTIPITTVAAGDLRADALAGKPESWMPLYTTNQTGGGGQLRRQCTRNYKIRPIRRRVSELRSEHGATRVVQWMGISIDEAQRMRDSDVAYIVHGYPLVDRRMSRHDCMAWLRRHGYPIPPKSSCIGCPFHDRAYWRQMRDQRPDEWVDAVEFDERIRDRRLRFADGVYLHASRVPLAVIDLSTPEERGQLSMFADECEGVCGV